MRKLPFYLAAAALAAGPVRAQMGDTLGEGPQVPLPAARQIVRDPVLTPEQERATFRLAPGYRVELVAAEPMVHDPVAAAYDLEGNLWVVEFTTFNSGLVKDIPDLASGITSVPTSRIVKLVSTHHDGHFDRRIDWLDGLQHPRGIAIVHDGVVIGDPPNLWFAREAHGTGRCDEKTLIASNFGVPGSDEDAGSLLWGRDNLLHDISFVYDYRYRSGHAERLPVLMRGQFGISQDDWGRLFFSRNSDQLRSDLFAPAYNVRNPDATVFPWANVNIAHDQVVWPSHPTPALNRAYRRAELGQSNGGIRDDGTLQEFTAACGSMVYRGSNFPAAVYGQVFVPEPSGNLIHLDLLQEDRARITAFDANPHGEFLTSTDTRFRPVGLVNPPDGSLLVLDFYRGLLEEYHILTSYLHEQTLARGLDKPMFGLGRIWKITYEGRPLNPAQPRLDRMSPAGLAGLLSSPDAWWREAAQQEIVERGGSGAVPALEALARSNGPDPARVAALWTLDGLGATSLELLQGLLKDPSSKVRQAAVRLHERFLAGPEAAAARRALASLVEDPSPDVYLQLALTLGSDRSPEALPFLEKLLARQGSDPWLAPALVTGLGGREGGMVRRLAAGGTTVPDTQAGFLLSLLAASVVHRADAAEVGQWVAWAGGQDNLPRWARLAIVSGMEDYFAPRFRRSMRGGAKLTAAEIKPLVTNSEPTVRASAQNLYRQLQDLEAEDRARAASARPLTAPERTLYDEGRVTFQICAACHQQGGTGLPNVAPSLVDSHWVAADPELAVRIILNGKEGTPGFPGAMPPIGLSLSDRQIAGAVTYIRNSWGLQFGAVTPAAVARVRRQLTGRIAAWSDKTLGRVESELSRLKR